jgi:RHH-type transcriptional regulator, rel operon repressor / antitoxin RelB
MAMPTTVLSCRIPTMIKKTIGSLAKETKRSHSFLVAEALSEYIDRKAWHLRSINEALEESKKGAFISHEAMTAWLKSWGTPNEQSAPKPDIFIK